MNTSKPGLRVGEVAEILSQEKIRATLDEKGMLEGLPFTSGMWKYCGKKYRVYRRSEKICVEGAHLRHMKNAVSLDSLRCDGADHDGCKRACLIFWKEAWLKRSEGAVELQPAPDWSFSGESLVAQKVDSEKTYSCQSTHLIDATEPVGLWALRQYVRDVTSGNFTVFHVLRSLLIVVYNKISRLTGWQDFGTVLGASQKTPVVVLNLQPEELVEVRSKKEISATLDVQGQNRGLIIDYEMLRHCGRRFRVLQRVDRIILETTGKMREIQNTVILEGNVCESICRRGCARGSYPMWREAWLKRVDGQTGK